MTGIDKSEELKITSLIALRETFALFVLEPVPKHALLASLSIFVSALKLSILFGEVYFVLGSQLLISLETSKVCQI